MVILISPAKKMNFARNYPPSVFSLPAFRAESEMLVAVMRTKTNEELSALMDISTQLALRNVERYALWHYPEKVGKATGPAAFVFDGEVYRGLNAPTFTADNLSFAQQHLRILSGLHGILKPLDLIQAHRLEMAAKLTVGTHKNLYDFWGDKIHQKITEALKESDDPTIINLSSKAYFKAARPKHFANPPINIHFKERKGAGYKVIVSYTKKARGLMAAFIIRNKITVCAQVKAFDEAGYLYNPDLSTATDWVFCRG